MIQVQGLMPFVTNQWHYTVKNFQVKYVTELKSWRRCYQLQKLHTRANVTNTVVAVCNYWTRLTDMRGWS
jgi:hypothetical protein